jgi:hypothetical protein
MADTIGLLRERPHVALVSLLNEYNGVDIHPDHVEFSNIKPLVGRRTKVTVTPKRNVNPFVKNPYTGLKEIVYNRLDLSVLFQPYTLKFDIPLPASTHVVIGLITELTGFVLEEDEFELEFINPYNASPYLLKAKPDSLRWVGSVEVELVHREELSDIVTKTDLGTLWKIGSTPKRFIGLDQFTSDGYLYGRVLSQIGPDSVVNIEPDIIARLFPNTPGEWVREEYLGEFNNLHGAKLIYNGYKQQYPSNQYNDATTRTLALELDPALNDYYVGRLVIHYNVENVTVSDPTPIQYKLPIELYQPELNGYKVSNEIAQYSTGDIINEVTDDWVIGRTIFNGDLWVVKEEPAPFNAYGAEVIYNGFNADYRKSPNPYLTHILVLRLSDHCTNFTGTCYIHYNLRLVG